MAVMPLSTHRYSSFPQIGMQVGVVSVRMLSIVKNRYLSCEMPVLPLSVYAVHAL